MLSTVKLSCHEFVLFFTDADAVDNGDTFLFLLLLLLLLLQFFVVCYIYCYFIYRY